MDCACLVLYILTRYSRTMDADRESILVLTKQIGSGVVNTAIKADMASPSAIREAETVMASLNKLGKQVVEKFDVSACTDITGFGLFRTLCRDGICQ